MGIMPAALVLAEILGVERLSHVVEKCANPGEQRIGSDGVGGVFRQLGDYQRMVIGSGRLELHPAQQGVIEFRQLEQRDVGRALEQRLQDRKQANHADTGQDASAKAQELAASSGVQLGELISVSYQDAPVYPVFDGRGGGGAAAEAAAVPIQPGQLTFTVTVNQTYAIE